VVQSRGVLHWASSGFVEYLRPGMLSRGRCSAIRAARGARQLCSAKLKEAPPVAPPPPPREGSGTSGLFKPVLALALAGTAYYFQDDIKEQMGMATSGSTSSGLSSDGQEIVATSKLKKEVEELAVKLQGELARERLQEVFKEKQEKARKEEALREERAQAALKKRTQVDEECIAQRTGNVDITKAREAIAEIIDSDPREGPLFVRLAWNNAATYDKTASVGGSEGACMRFMNGNEASWAENNGLLEARSRLDLLKSKFPELSTADLWSLAGTVALEEMGAPEMKWRSGRRDFTQEMDVLPETLLPHGDGGAIELRQKFYRMGLSDKEIVCLSAARALGDCRPEDSSAWGRTRNPTTFSNEYFTLLLKETWSNKTSHQDMDMALVQDESFKQYVEEYANDEAKFFADFAKVWIKFQEAGVRSFHGRRRYFFFGPRE